MSNKKEKDADCNQETLLLLSCIPELNGSLPLHLESEEPKTAYCLFKRNNRRNNKQPLSKQVETINSPPKETSNDIYSR